MMVLLLVVVEVVVLLFLRTGGGGGGGCAGHASTAAVAPFRPRPVPGVHTAFLGQILVPEDSARDLHTAAAATNAVRHGVKLLLLRPDRAGYNRHHWYSDCCCWRCRPMNSFGTTITTVITILLGEQQAAVAGAGQR